MKNVIHYPSMKTILMVEKAIRDSKKPLKREALKRKLPTKVMHQTLNLILKYLEERNLINDKHEGISWIHEGGK